MTISLAATRSSGNWQSRPGNWDRLNTRALYPSSSEWGIPDVPKAFVAPQKMIAYNDKGRCENPEPGSAIHFFLDDYRFETVWSQPLRSLARISRAGMALSPDFSLWTEMPLSMQLWQVYRSRWCAMWMHEHGIAVIPTISWSTPDSWNFCFDGVQHDSVVAISTVGVTQDSIDLFRAGLSMLWIKLRPTQILVYGRMLPELEHFPVKLYPHIWRQ